LAHLQQRNGHQIVLILSKVTIAAEAVIQFGSTASPQSYQLEIQAVNTNKRKYI
jgi:hypothetical protein